MKHDEETQWHAHEEARSMDEQTNTDAATNGSGPSGTVRPEDDVRLTAYALDELADDQRAEVEALLARDEHARAHVEELRDLGRTLARGLRFDLGAAPTPLSSAQREAIAGAAGGPRPRGRRLSSPWSRSVGAIAATLLGIGLVGAYAKQAGWLTGDAVRLASLSEGSPSGQASTRKTGSRSGSGGMENALGGQTSRSLGYGRSDSVAGASERSEATVTESPWASASAPAENAVPTDSEDGGIHTMRGNGDPSGTGADSLSSAHLHGFHGPGGVSPDTQDTATTPTRAGEAYRGPGDSAPPGQPADQPTTDATERLTELGYGDLPAADDPGAPSDSRGTRGERPAAAATEATDGLALGRGSRAARPASPGAAGTSVPPSEEGTVPRAWERGLEGSGLEGSIVLPDREGAGGDRGRAYDGVTSRDDLSLARRAQAGGEGYETLPENPFVQVLVDPRSTFSVDVDTASYANVRRFLRQGQLPPAASVRIEELINAFSYAYPAPEGEHPFAVHAELVEAPWKDGHKLLRVGLQGTLPTVEEPVGRNLVFLVDVSGSMSAADKLPLVQRSLELLVDALRPRDTIGIVTYAGSSGIALQPTAVAEKEVVLAAIQALRSGGSTNGAAGIVDAYRLAQEHFVEGGVNRVVLATDGDFNVGLSDEAGLERLITQKRETGVFLSVLGFGQGNLQDAKMETLADKGNGNYAYIDSLREARKVLVRNLDGTLETIAKDVKLQVEFNPLRIQAFRLIGYENRVLEHRDFADDRKDAGEIGAGHSVTALYELVPVGADLAGTPPLRYQRPGVPSEPTEEAASDEALFVSLRYKLPQGDRSILVDVPVADSEVPFEEAGQETRFAAAVASFGMLLRGSEHAGATSLEAVHRWASDALGADPSGDRREFLTLVDWAIQASLERPR